MIAALDRIDIGAIGYQDKLDLLRAYSLTFIRLGSPNEATKQRLIEKFDPMLPATQRELNWELAEMLVYLEAPSAPAKLMSLLRNAPSLPFYASREWINPILRSRGNPGLTGPAGASDANLMKQEDQIQYAELLRVVKNGWTPELREEYFRWFPTMGAFRGGSAYSAGIQTIKADAVSQLPPDARQALQAVIDLPMVGRGRGGGGGGGGGAPAPRGGAAPAGN